MKELLFGWITKGQYNLNFLDSIIAYIEIFVLIFLLYLFIYGICNIKEKINNRKKERRMNKHARYIKK